MQIFNYFLWYWIVGMTVMAIVTKMISKRETEDFKTACKKLDTINDGYGGAGSVFIIVLGGLFVLPLFINGLFKRLVNEDTEEK